MSNCNSDLSHHGCCCAEDVLISKVYIESVWTAVELSLACSMTVAFHAHCSVLHLVFMLWLSHGET